MANIPRAWNFNIDFMGRMRPILWLSALLTAASLLAVWQIGLNLGTDFAGGYEIQVSFPKEVSENQIRALLEPMHLEDARVQRFGSEGEHEFLILVRDAVGKLSPETQASVKTALQGLVIGPKALLALRFADSGESLVAQFDAPVAEEALRKALTGVGLGVVHVGHAERHDWQAQPEYTVQLENLADDIAKTLHAGLALGDVAPSSLLKRVEFVGPQVGADLRNQGVLAVVYALLLILVYVGLRFDMYFAPGAIIATLHDIVLTMGIFCVFRIDFNLTVVAAILTLIGFSLNDTIVVYDRIRENVAHSRGGNLPQLINQSINETMSRTILTSGTVALVCAALVLLGGPFLRGFSITMFVGVVVGTYSSVAVASPVYMALRNWGEGLQRSGPGRAVRT